MAAALGLATAIVWGVVWGAELYWANRHASSYRWCYANCFAVIHAELALRAVAIRDFTQRHGQLPASLDDCELDFRHCETSLVRTVVFRGYMEPEVALDQPPASLNFLGLPIVYARGVPGTNDGSWFESSDTLPPDTEKRLPREVREFLEAHGGLPATTPTPFALSDLFLRDRMPGLRVLEAKAASVGRWLWGGLACIGLGTLGLAIAWRRGEHHPFGCGALGLALVAAALAPLLLPIWATCYLRTSFTPRMLPLAERLRLLEEAVRRGEVPEDVARTARDAMQRFATNPGQAR